MEKTPYRKTDKTISHLNRHYGRMFRKAAAFDELNIIDISHEIYDEAYELAQQEAIRLVQAVYGSYSRSEEVCPRCRKDAKVQFDTAKKRVALIGF